MVRLIISAVLIAGLAGAQPVPQAADGVVVARLEDPRVMDAGVKIQVAGQLRVVRVLAGDLEEGDRFPFSWEYRAMQDEPRELEKRLPQGACVWLLMRGEGGWRPEPFLPYRGGGFAGGVALSLPGEQSPPEYWPPPDSSWKRALAHELRWVMDALAEKHGSELNPKWKILTRGAFVPAMNSPQRWFSAAGTLLSFLPVEETVEVYRGLAGSPYPNPRMAGLAGLVRAAQPGAAVEMERDWALLSQTLESIRVGPAMQSMPRLPKEDLLALARIAISEASAPAIEQTAAHHLHHAGPEALPYLAVLLENPLVSVRTVSIQSVCTLLRATVNPDPRYCEVIGLTKDAEREAEVTSYWRSRIQGMGYAQLRPPARYRAAPAIESYYSGMPMGERVWRVAVALRGERTSHPLRSQLDERDLTTLTAILSAMLEADFRHRKAFEQRVHQGRLQGAPLGREEFEADYGKLMAAWLAALEQARQQLSAAGWRALDDHLHDRQ